MLLPLSSIDLISNKDNSLFQQFEDKIFISGILIELENSSISISIDKTCPIVALNNTVAKEFENKSGISIYTINSFKTDTGSKYILLSAGAIINVIKGSSIGHILLNKDHLAPADAGNLTEPAGRCGEHPYETIFKELNEELDIVVLDRGDKKLLVVGPESTSISHLQKRLFSIKDHNVAANFKPGEISSLEYVEPHSA